MIRVTLLLLALSAPASAQTSDSAAIALVVERFHAALASGDSSAALALMSLDVVVLESGGAETLHQYRNGHLAGDITFAKAVPRRRTSIAVTVSGDVAWASSTGTVEGEFRGRSVNSSSAELMVLSRSGGTWVIRAIHWSSRARRPS